MKKSGFFLSIIVLLMMSAAAQATPPAATFGLYTLDPDPACDATVTYSPDQSTMTLIYNTGVVPFAVTAGTSVGTTEDSKTCKMQVQVAVSQGQTKVQIDTDYRGSNALPEGAYGWLVSKFRDMSALVSPDHVLFTPDTDKASFPFMGDLFQNYNVRHSPQLDFCSNSAGTLFTLEIETTIGVAFDPTLVSSAAQMSVDSLDAATVNLGFHLLPCTP